MGPKSYPCEFQVTLFSISGIRLLMNEILDLGGRKCGLPEWIIHHWVNHSRASPPP